MEVLAGLVPPWLVADCLFSLSSPGLLRVCVRVLISSHNSTAQIELVPTHITSLNLSP